MELEQLIDLHCRLVRLGMFIACSSLEQAIGATCYSTREYAHEFFRFDSLRQTSGTLRGSPDSTRCKGVWRIID